MTTTTKRLLRAKEILGDKKSTPPSPPLIPVSRSAWFEGVRTGRYPKPVRLGPRTVAWRFEDIMELIDQN